MPLTLRSPEKFQEALDLIAAGVTRPTKISKAIGVAYRTYLNWMVASSNGDPDYLVTYNGETTQFAKAVKLATRLAGLELRGMVMQEAIFGYEEEQTSDGQVVWALDPEACAIEDLDVRYMLYGRRDGLPVRDGKLVPHTITKKAPWAQQLAFLQAQFSDMRPVSTVNQNVNVKGGMTLGVGVATKVNYSAPVTIPPAPPIPLAPPMVEVLGDVTESDPELDDMINGPPSEENLVSVAPEIAPAPEPAPVAVDAMPTRQPRTQLEADLFAKLEAARNKPKDSL